MKKILRKLLLMTLVCFCSWPLCRGDEEVARRYQKAAKRYKFEIQPRAKFPRRISGTVVSVSEVERELDRFFEALDELGVSFVKKSGLKKVMFCRNLTLNGMPCGGVAYGNCIYLNVGFSKETVYHEMFHVFDSASDDKSWQKWNHKKFRYRGIDFPDRPVSKGKKRKLQKHYAKYDYDFNRDFVSDYAQSNEKEDRAETFAMMIGNSRKFMSLARRSPALWGKMQYIIELTGRKSLLGKDYWVKKLGCEVLQHDYPYANKTRRE
ncbi:MAG: hypothetical protein E7047_04115 [Lentisphaerae bacterium]|nr:hypothetical protein [Lentisphaerota bacterium]